jgi:hypothetical protein
MGENVIKNTSLYKFTEIGLRAGAWRGERKKLEDMGPAAEKPNTTGAPCPNENSAQINLSRVAILR